MLVYSVLPSQLQVIPPPVQERYSLATGQVFSVLHTRH